MQFGYSTASSIVFGSGWISLIGKLAFGFGNKILIIHGGPVNLYNLLHEILNEYTFEFRSEIFNVGEQFTEIIHKVTKSSSMKGNPILLSEHELRNILEMVF